MNRYDQYTGQHLSPSMRESEHGEWMRIADAQEIVRACLEYTRHSEGCNAATQGRWCQCGIDKALKEARELVAIKRWWEDESKTGAADV